MPPLPVNVFDGSRETLDYIWKKLSPNLPQLPDDLPRDEVGLAYWLLAKDTLTFVVGDPAAPAGVFVLNDIQPGASAVGHVLMWEKEAVSYADLVASAKAIAANAFQLFGLRRITGMTPANLVPALAFLLHVGFKREGRVREAVLIGGAPEDMIISGMTKADMRAALGLPESATIEVEAAPAAT